MTDWNTQLGLSDLEQQYGLPAGLLASQLHAESGGNPDAISPKGAVGLFQFMPQTAKQYGIDPTDPMQSAHGAAIMMSDLTKQFGGDISKAVAAYNWGSGNLSKHGLENAPPETAQYVQKVLGGLHSSPQTAPTMETSDILVGGDSGDNNLQNSDVDKMNKEELEAELAKLEPDIGVSPADENSDIDGMGKDELEAELNKLQGNQPEESLSDRFLRPLKDTGNAIKEEYQAGAKKFYQPFPQPTGHIGQDLLTGLEDPLKRSMGAIQAGSSIITGPARGLLGNPLSHAAQSAGMSPLNAKRFIEQPVELAANVLAPMGAAKYGPEIANLGKSLMNTAIMKDTTSMGGPVSNIAAKIGQNETLQTLKSGKNARDFDAVDETTDNLSKNTNAAYENADAAGAVLTPEASINAGNTVRTDVEKAIDSELDPKLHSQTEAALNLFNKKAEKGLTIQSIENTRKQLGRIAYGKTTSPEDAFAAKHAINSLDNVSESMEANPDMLVSGSPDAVAALKEARYASTIERRHSEIADIVRKAAGNPNKLQTEFAKLYNNQKKFNSYAPDEQEMIKKMTNPSFWNKTLKTVGYAGFGGGHSTVPVLETLSAPWNPSAIPSLATGTAANVTRNYLARGQTENLLKSIAGKSRPIAVSTKAAASGGNKTSPKMLTYSPTPPPATNIISDSNQSAKILSSEEQAALDARRAEEENLGFTPGVRAAQAKNNSPYSGVKTSEKNPRQIRPTDKMHSYYDPSKDVMIDENGDIIDLPDIELPEVKKFKKGGKAKKKPVELPPLNSYVRKLMTSN